MMQPEAIQAMAAVDAVQTYVERPNGATVAEMELRELDHDQLVVAVLYCMGQVARYAHAFTERQ